LYPVLQILLAFPSPFFSPHGRQTFFGLPPVLDTDTLGKFGMRFYSPSLARCYGYSLSFLHSLYLSFPSFILEKPTSHSPGLDAQTPFHVDLFTLLSFQVPSPPPFYFLFRGSSSFSTFLPRCNSAHLHPREPPLVCRIPLHRPPPFLAHPRLSPKKFFSLSPVSPYPELLPGIFPLPHFFLFQYGKT